jgi:ABC-type spermidine/putrescine transport system permease subunit I
MTPWKARADDGGQCAAGFRYGPAAAAVAGGTCRMAQRRPCADARRHLVPLLINAAHVVGFTLWTTWLSFTPSDLLPEYTFVGLRSYWSVTRAPSTQIAYLNLVIYSFAFVALATLIGFVLAVLLDQRIRGENVLRTIYLYPLAVSFVVTGTVWSWLLNPGIGIQKLVHDLGWTSFRFDWLVDRDMAIWTIVIAAIWQSSGFAMALFLAGLRSVDADLIKAAQIDGAGPMRFYCASCCEHRRDPDRRAGHSAAVRHQDLRPGAGADRRRTGHRHHAAGAGGVRFHVPARAIGARLGGGGPAAARAARRAAPLLRLHALARSP